jgi:hypothetical protein
LAPQLLNKSEDKMKTIITSIIFFSVINYAQISSDSTMEAKRNQELKQNREQKSELQTDQQNIGPKQDPETSGKQNRKKKDVFIDKDGDGICDSRQSGMSFNKMRKRIGSGQQGPGKGKHGSGSENGSQNQFGNGSGN